MKESLNQTKQYTTLTGVIVGSQSELIIFNLLLQMQIDFDYKYAIKIGAKDGLQIVSDFHFITIEGHSIAWDHYDFVDSSEREAIAIKEAWYKIRGFIKGVNYFVSYGSVNTGLDNTVIKDIALFISKKIVMQIEALDVFSLGQENKSNQTTQTTHKNTKDLNSSENSLRISLIPADIESQQAFEKANMSGVTIISPLNLDNYAKSSPKNKIQALIKPSDILVSNVEASDMGQVNYLLKIVAESKILGILTLVMLTRNSQCLNQEQVNVAENNIDRIKLSVDTVLVLPFHSKQQDKALEALYITYKYELMIETVRSLAEMTGRRNLIGVTHEDIKKVTVCMGEAMIGIGYYKGNKASDRGVKATEIALNAQTFNRKKLSTAKGVLVSIFSGMDLGMGEFETIGKVLNDIVDRDATVIVGTVIYPNMTNEIRVMIMATGLELCKFSTEITTEVTGRLEKELHRVLGDNVLDNSETDEMSYLHIPAFLRKK